MSGILKIFFLFLLVIAGFPLEIQAQPDTLSDPGSLVVPMSRLRSKSGFANYSFWGAAFGGMAYQGDLSDNNQTRQASPCLTFSRTSRAFTHLYTRAALTAGWVSGADRNSADPERIARNLSFRSSILELQAHLIYQLKDNYHRYQFRPIWAPYFLGGVGLYRFNPKAKLAGEWVPLRPLGTEGQLLSNTEIGLYNRIQTQFSLGLGVNRRVSDRMNMNFELNFRLLRTDYLDDVSGVYPDKEEMALVSPRGYLLSYRGDPTLGFPDPGTQRGDFRKRDSYFSLTVGIQYINQ